MKQVRRMLGSAMIAAAALALAPAPVLAQNAPAPQGVPGPAAPTYADLATLVEDASVVALVEIRRQAEVERARAPGLAPGDARLYLQARTEALIAGRSAVGEELAFLADRALQANGKPPRVRKQRFIVFADPVPGRAGQLQLVDPKAMLPAEPKLVEQVRQLAAAFAGGDVPPVVTGVRDVLSVPGNLAGESETQMFVETASGAPLSISVIRRPGQPPQWGVSWSEIVDQSARAPAAQTIEWYRLACGLPRALPADAFLQQPSPQRRQAEADYALILEQLGPCARNRS